MQIFEILLQGRRKDTRGSESMSLYFCAVTELGKTPVLPRYGANFNKKERSD